MCWSCFRKSVKLVMFNENVLEDITTETIVANATHWLLKAGIYVKCFESVLDANVKLVLNTNKYILSKEQDCCNSICVQNEIHTEIKLYIPKVILLLLFIMHFGICLSLPYYYYYSFFFYIEEYHR